jgi:hypothetical protein
VSRCQIPQHQDKHRPNNATEYETSARKHAGAIPSTCLHFNRKNGHDGA